MGMCVTSALINFWTNAAVVENSRESAMLRTEFIPCRSRNRACFIAGAVKEKSADGQGDHDGKHQNDKCVIRFV